MKGKVEEGNIVNNASTTLQNTHTHITYKKKAQTCNFPPFEDNKNMGLSKHTVYTRYF